MPMPFKSVTLVAPRVAQFAPRPIAPVSTVGAGVKVPTPPGIVPAMSRPGWPAPTSMAVIPTTVKAREEIPAGTFNAGRIVSESIFGGPVTVGDPAVTTVSFSPYTDKQVTSFPTGLPTDEGWSDIFGMQHGAEVPPTAMISRRNRGGAFGIRTSLGADTVVSGTSTVTKVAIAAAAVALVGGVGWMLLSKKK